MLGALSLAGCNASAKPSRDPNTLVVLELADADTLNPFFANNYYSFLYYGLIFDGLINVGDNFTNVPDLATSWKSTPDKLHWTVELRRGVKWSDGAPFTSHDVVWTWRTQMDPATGFPYRGQFTYIKSVTAEGPYRVRFDLRNKNALFESQGLGAAILPAHLLERIPHAQLRTSDFGEHPIGTGPYVLEKWRHDQSAAFKANPNWWGGTQTVKRIVFEIVLNDQARNDAMIEGSADLDDNIAPASFDELKLAHTKLQLIRIPDTYTTFLYVNFRRPGLNDIAVRQAMMYGFDRKAIVDGLYRGDFALATSLVPQGLRLWYDPKVKKYPYDPDKARMLLERTGYRLGADGVRRRGKVRLSYVLDDTQASGHLDLDAAFQADMRAIGIAITIRSIDFATYINDAQDGNFDLGAIQWGGVPDPD
ncbi:MAG: ABC transporter substrate-binding protein, partial [Vulcanimicrobiaceae bacterium]